MKVSYELEQGYIDVWNEESEEWDRYIKIEKKSVVEEEKKIPEKLSNIKFENGKFYLPVGNKQNYIIREVDKVFLDKINSIIDYLKSKGE